MSGRTYEPIADHAGPHAPKSAKRRRALKLIAGLCEQRGDTRVAFVRDRVVVVRNGPELAVWKTDNLIETYTERLKSELGSAMFTDWMENPKP